jgi:hypothetical protein
VAYVSNSHSVYEGSKSVVCSINTDPFVTGMMYSIKTIPAVWASFIILSLPSSAQETTNTTNLSSCPYSLGTFSSNAPVNSTGSQSVQWSQQAQDWYFTTTLNDTRSPFLETQMHDIQGYISAPTNTEAHACVYMLGGINATGGGEDGCEGVLSRSCVNWLTNTVSYTTEDRGNVSRCASAPSREEVREACGTGVVMSVSRG